MDGCRALFCSINNVLGKLQTTLAIALNFNLIPSRGLVVLPQEMGFGVVCLSPWGCQVCLSWPRGAGESCEVTAEKEFLGKLFLAREWVNGAFLLCSAQSSSQGCSSSCQGGQQ